MRTTVLLTAALLTAFASRDAKGQTRTTIAEIKDSSAAESPVKVSGRVTFVEETKDNLVRFQFSIDAGLLNNSSKPIMCYHIVVGMAPSMGPGLNAQYTLDRFFGDEMIVAPGGTAAVQDVNPTWHSSALPIEAVPATRAPAAQAKVVFVQFSDGSKFGDEKWGEQLRADRSGAIADLTSMQTSYQAGGSVADSVQGTREGTKAKFSSVNSVILDRVKDTLNSKGSSAALAEIQKCLANAEKRKTYM